MAFEHSLLGYRVDLYFHDYKPAIEVDEFGFIHLDIYIYTLTMNYKDKKQ